MTGGERTPPDRENNTVDRVIGVVFQREEFLERLSEGTADKPELVETIGVSRSTVDRALKELRNEGLVEKRSGQYGLTLYGKLSLRSYRRLFREIDTLRRSRDSLRTLPPSTELDPVFFRGGTVISEDDGDRRPTAVIRKLLEEAETFWTVTKSPHFELVSVAHRRVVEEGMKFELIHSEDSLERLNLHYPDIVESALESGNLDMYSSDAVPPFGLIKATRSERDTVVLVLYGQEGAAETLIVNETPFASTRYGELFRAYKEDASRVEIDD